MKIPVIRLVKSTEAQPRPAIIAAVAVEGTRATAALVDDRGYPLVERSVEFSRPGLRVVAMGIARLLIDVGSSAERGDRELTAIGVSVPGYVDPEDDRVTIPKRPGTPEPAIVWNRVALKEAIRAELGAELGAEPGAARTYSTQCPIVLSARSAACVSAEAWTGAAHGETNVVFLSIDDKIDAGLLVDGRIVCGSAGRAGAVGWFGLTETFRKEFEEAGCLTLEGGRGAVVRRTIESWTNEKGSLVSRLSVTHPSDISPEMVLRAARGGDALALRVVGDLCSWIGRGVADLISTLNPAVVVIGGGFGNALKPFLGELRREARRWAEPGAGRQCRIVAASLGAKGALIGAARLAMLARD